VENKKREVYKNSKQKTHVINDKKKAERNNLNNVNLHKTNLTKTHLLTKNLPKTIIKKKTGIKKGKSNQPSVLNDAMHEDLPKSKQNPLIKYNNTTNDNEQSDNSESAMKTFDSYKMALLSDNDAMSEDTMKLQTY